MLHWRRRLKNWAIHVRSIHGHVPWLGMLRGIMSGPVTREVWRHRIWTCARCPIRSPGGWICHRMHGDRDLGCNCDLVFLCLSAAPYASGCYARNLVPTEGWPAIHYTWCQRFRAVIAFLFPARPNKKPVVRA